MTTNDNTKESKQEIIESIKQTCFDCIDYDGQTVTWQSVLDKYLEEIITKALIQSVQEAKAEERERVVTEIKDNLRVIKKSTTGTMRTAISSVESIWALHTDPEYRDIYKSSEEYKKDIGLLQIVEQVENLYQVSQNLRVQYKDGQGVDLVVGISKLRNDLLTSLRKERGEE